MIARIRRIPSLEPIIWMAGIALVLLFLSVLPTVAQTAHLMERDSESWGLPYGGVRLDKELTTQVGKMQRFNPAVVSNARGLTNVKLYLEFPDTFDVQMSKAWTPQNGRTYSATLGPINRGEAVNAFEAIYFIARKPGLGRVSYLISAQELEPVTGEIKIVVVAPVVLRLPLNPAPKEPEPQLASREWSRVGHP